MSDENKKQDELQKPLTPTESKINHLNKQENEALYWSNLQKEWIEDLRTNPRYKVFYDRFHHLSIESFISEYSSAKHLWLRYGEFYKKQNEERVLEYKDAAYACIWEIQQKKLFNLQCQWRAELIRIDGVEICRDFDYWEHHIEECPFLPPVTQEELEFYTQYLMGPHYDRAGGFIGWPVSWQNYDAFKEEYENSEEESTLPEWYAWYDLHKGTGQLMILPDIRGEKEEFYMDLTRKKIHDDLNKEMVAHPEKYPVYDPRPFINQYQNPALIPEFIKTFEDKLVLETYDSYVEGTKTVFEDDDEMEDILRSMVDAREFIPVEAHSNWREGIKNAWNNFRRNKIVEALPIAYDEYIFRNEMKIAHEGKEDKFYKEHAQKVRGMIIQGRIMNGEPGDLNF